MADRKRRGWRSPGSEDPSSDDRKSYGQILEEQIEAGLQELCRTARGLLLSGLSAGLDIGFGVIVMAVVLTVGPGEVPDLALRILQSSAYSIGFIFVVLGRSELFTEHTTLAAIPVLAGEASVPRLLRLWGLIYVSNVVGAAAFALLATYVLTSLGSASKEAFETLATDLLDHGPLAMFLSAVLAGWLMGLLSWLVQAARDTSAKLLVVWLVTSVIGFAGLHHSIAGVVEVVAGLLVSPEVHLADVLRFMGLATLGNAVGGVFFVALVKWGHATQSAG